MLKNNKKSNSKITNKYTNTTKTTKNEVSFGKRALALILDLIIINLVIVYPFRGAIIKYFGKLSMIKGISNDIILPTGAYWLIFIISILAMLYFTFFEYYISQTPGKMMLRLKVVSSIDNNDDITFWKSLTRNCFILPFFPFYILWVIEPMYLIFYKESLLDKITHTKTVYEYANQTVSQSKNNDDEEYKLEKV